MLARVRESKLSVITAISFLPPRCQKACTDINPSLPGLGHKKQNRHRKSRSRGPVDVIVPRPDGTAGFRFGFS
jgi:hypothetical protein